MSRKGMTKEENRKATKIAKAAAKSRMLMGG